MKLPHSLFEGVLKLRAHEYAGSLYPGAIVDASDRVYLAEEDWGRFLTEALAHRGLILDGDVVVPAVHTREEITT